MHEKSGAVPETLARFIFRFLLAAFVAVSIYVLFFSHYLRITEIEITGMREIGRDEIKQNLQSFLDGKFLGIVPKNNFLFISQNRIAHLLKDNFKKIRGVTIEKKFPDSVSIVIEERESILVWCAGESCFLIDDGGISYNAADFNSPEILQNNLLRINDESARSVSLGEKIMNIEYEQYVMGIKEALENIDQKVGSEAYETPSNMAEEIKVRTEKGILIYFSAQYPLKNAVRALDIVLKKEIPKDKQNDIEYIDLRSEGKVFYKFKNTEPQSETKTLP